MHRGKTCEGTGRTSSISRGMWGHQKLGMRPGTDSPSQPSEETNPPKPWFLIFVWQPQEMNTVRYQGKWGDSGAENARKCENLCIEGLGPQDPPWPLEAWGIIPFFPSPLFFCHLEETGGFFSREVVPEPLVSSSGTAEGVCVSGLKTGSEMERWAGCTFLTELRHPHIYLDPLSYLCCNQTGKHGILFSGKTEWSQRAGPRYGYFWLFQWKK